MKIEFRSEVAGDNVAIRSVNLRAFGGDDEANLVDALRAAGLVRVSMVALCDGQPIGHILYSEIRIVTHDGDISALSLAPMAVVPEFQNQGIGSQLARRSLESARELGHQIVIVLGHEHFYPRFGFSAELARTIESPFSGTNSWMALELNPGALTGVRGWAHYSAPFGLGVQARPVFRPDRTEWIRMRRNLWPEDDDNQHEAEVHEYFRMLQSGCFFPVLSKKTFVADDGHGRLCGFLEASIRPMVDGCDSVPVGYVEGWYVDEAARRQGIGSRLMQAAERWVTSLGCREMASDAHVENDASIRAHRALGFEELPQTVVLRKPLESNVDQIPVDSAKPFRWSLEEVPGIFAVCRLPAESPLPDWAIRPGVSCIARTDQELSIACLESDIAMGVEAERGWRCLRVVGPLPFTQVGVLATLAGTLASAGVSVFVFSTFATDYIMCKSERFAIAVSALRSEGHDMRVSLE